MTDKERGTERLGGGREREGEKSGEHKNNSVNSILFGRVNAINVFLRATVILSYRIVGDGFKRGSASSLDDLHAYLLVHV